MKIKLSYIIIAVLFIIIVRKFNYIQSTNNNINNQLNMTEKEHKLKLCTQILNEVIILDLFENEIGEYKITESINNHPKMIFEHRNKLTQKYWSNNCT